MSRSIITNHSGLSQAEQELIQTEEGKLILTQHQERKVTLLIRGNRLIAASVWDEEPSKIGAVYLGKIKKVVKNIEACFVEIADGELCFLSFEDAKSPFVVNRNFDGRLLEGDELLVQVNRDAMKTKQASVTARISLAGKYLVLVSGSRKANMSSKLSLERKEALFQLLKKYSILNERKELIQEKNIPNFGMIVRTQAGTAAKEDELIEEYNHHRHSLIALYDAARHRTCFSCLQEPLKPFQASMAIANVGEYSEVVTDLPLLYKELTHYVHTRLGATTIPVRFYEDEYSLSKLYSIKSKLQEALSNKVWLKSGGYLIIEPTEALTVIDVNTGKINSGRNMEETFRHINQEAAEEIAFQLRLRNLSGIIIIDFISTKNKEYQEELMQNLKYLVQKDRLTTTVVDMTPLGLVEITRKKQHKTLKEQFL